jgi:hypothetical protein
MLNNKLKRALMTRESKILTKEYGSAYDNINGDKKMNQ